MQGCGQKRYVARIARLPADHATSLMHVTQVVWTARPDGCPDGRACCGPASAPSAEGRLHVRKPWFGQLWADTTLASMNGMRYAAEISGRPPLANIRVSPPPSSLVQLIPVFSPPFTSAT
eukprot:352987-Chlamydomonas_euryale.AAC.21